jgi:hypothetical protein
MHGCLHKNSGLPNICDFIVTIDPLGQVVLNDMLL